MLFSSAIFFFNVIIISTKGSAICHNYTPFFMAIPKDLTYVLLSVFLFIRLKSINHIQLKTTQAWRWFIGQSLNSYHAKEGIEIYKSIINEYLKYEYSLIPVNGEKKPYVYWKPYQYKKANTEDIFGWYNKFPDVNIGIVTGNIRI